MNEHNAVPSELPTAAPSNRRAETIRLWLLFALTLPLITPRIRGADEIQYFSLLRSLAFDRDLSFENEYRHFYERDPLGLAGFKATFIDRRETATGRHINFGSVGAGLLWAPFYGAAHVGVLLARQLGMAVAADGFSRPYEMAVCYSSTLYGFLALLLIRRMLRDHGAFDGFTADAAVIGLWLGTPLVYYMTIAPGFAHAPALFAVTLTLSLWLRLRDRGEVGWQSWALVGAAGGLAGLVRPHGVLFLAAPAADLIWRQLRARRFAAGLLHLAGMAAAAGLVLVPQILLAARLGGTPGISPLVARKMTYSSPHFFQVLFDPAHGLYFWTPLLLPATLGLLLAVRARRDAVFVWLGLAFLLQIWVNGSVESWHQAGAFGSRRFVESTVIFVWGLAVVLVAIVSRWGRRVASLLVAVGVWWNLSLMVQFGLRLMDRQKLDWPRIAVNQVTAVPSALGRHAWLFLADRERLVRETAPKAIAPDRTPPRPVDPARGGR